MELIRSVGKDVLRSAEVRYVAKFLVFFVVIYYALFFWVGITIKGGLYSEFVVDRLNLVDWLSASILHAANILTHVFGLNTYVDESSLRVVGGTRVILGYPCLGLGVFSFWSAFTLSQDLQLRKRVQWLAIGVFCVWFINCLRVSVLLTALSRKWPLVRDMDHHFTFNVIAYTLIFSLIFLFYRMNRDAARGQD